MAYKVKYTTLAILKDKTTGNIPQTTETIYTDWDIPDIKSKIDLHYQVLDKKLVAVIDSIERVEGFCLPVNL